VAIVPLATGYSISEMDGKPHELNDGFRKARVFYLSFIGAALLLIAASVLMLGVLSAF